MVSFICLCLPPLWAHQPPRIVWQFNMSSPAIPSSIPIAHWTTSSYLMLPVLCAESSLGCERRGPFCMMKIWPP